LLHFTEHSKIRNAIYQEHILNTYISPTEADANSLFHQACSDENRSVVVLGNAVETVKYSALGR
jgi:hypothetical protein